MLNALFIYLSLYKFSKFLMSFLKTQVSFPSNFASIFSAAKHNSSVLCLTQNYILWSKEPIKEQIIWIFKCSSQDLSNFSCQFWNGKSIPLQIFHYSSLSWHITSLEILNSYIFYFKQKDPINVPILRLSSALVKICHISHVIFQTTSQFLIHNSSVVFFS